MTVPRRTSTNDRDRARFVERLADTRRKSRHFRSGTRPGHDGQTVNSNCLPALYGLVEMATPASPATSEMVVEGDFSNFMLKRYSIEEYEDQAEENVMSVHAKRWSVIG